MELIAFTLIMLVAAGAGVAAAVAMLWTVFVCMSRLAVPGSISSASTAVRSTVDGDAKLGDAPPLAPAA